MFLYIDIHRHMAYKGNANMVLRNIFHSQTDEAKHANYASIGLHPWHVNPESLEHDVQKVKDSLALKNVLAIGEAGLDKSIACDFQVQSKAFQMQLKLATDYKKPMVIHCVRAYNEMLNLRLLSPKSQPWIFHWFNSSYQMGCSLIELDCYLSFGHMLFKENSKAYKSFKKFPLDRIFLETDDTAFSIVEVYQKAAWLRGLSVQLLQEQIMQNFTRCFGIKL